MYLKPLVTNSRNVHLVEDIFAMGYVGGGGAEFYNDTAEYSEFIGASGSARAKKSLMSVLVPYGSKDMQNPLDITGRLPANMVAAGGEQAPGSYPNSEFLKRRFQLQRTS